MGRNRLSARHGPGAVTGGRQSGKIVFDVMKFMQTFLMLWGCCIYTLPPGAKKSSYTPLVHCRLLETVFRLLLSFVLNTLRI